MSTGTQIDMAGACPSHLDIVVDTAGLLLSLWHHYHCHIKEWESSMRGGKKWCDRSNFTMESEFCDRQRFVV